MSYTQLIIFKDGKADSCVEYRNAWGGSARIWDSLFKAHVPKNHQYDNWLGTNNGDDKRLWDIATRTDLPMFSRAVHAFTFDHFYVRNEHLGRADTETQADCKAATTAKRNALCNALNIVIAQDCLSDESDAAMEGDPNAKITLEQADELEHRAQLTNSNIPAFLKFAGVKMFREIPASKYNELDAMLRRKEKLE